VGVEAPLQVSFYALAGLAQFAAAAWLVARERRREWAWVLAGVFALNGLGAWSSALVLQWHANDALSHWSQEVVRTHLEPATFILLAYLALAFPQRPRVLRPHPWALPAVVALASVLLEASLQLWGGSLERPRTASVDLNVGRLLLGYALPSLAWCLLLGRWALLWARDDLHVPRHTFQLVYAAIALRAANVLVFTFAVWQQPPRLAVFAMVLNALPLALLLAGLVHLVRVAREPGPRRRPTQFVAAFVLAGLAEGILAVTMGGSGAFFGNVFLHLDLYVLRPVLVWFAVAPAASGRGRDPHWMGEALFGLLAFATCFVGLYPAMERLHEPVRTPAAVLAAAGVAVAAVGLLRSWLRPPARAPGDDQPWLPGETVLGRHRVEALLGEGSAGEAYRATDLDGGGPVVLKRTRRLDAAGVRVLLAEAQAVSGLGHPRIVRLLGQGRHQGEPVLVLEHLAGGSLAMRLADGPLPAREAVAIALDLLDALEAAHAHGLVHRDVKPSNVLLDGAGRAKLGDFGAAAPAADDLGPALQAGSLRYLAPEQALGRSADHRADLYAAAVVLQEMLTGRHPVPADLSAGEARRRIAAGLLEPPEGVPPRLAAVLRRGLRKAPSRRFQSAAEFRRALQAAAAPPAPLPLAKAAPRARERARAGAGAARPSRS
jgi:hypothetical protein